MKGDLVLSPALHERESTTATQLRQETNHRHEIVCEGDMLILLPVTCVMCGY